MTTMTNDLDQIDLINADRYAERGYPWEDWALLRREAPIYRYERPGVRPFWAVTKHRDIQQVSRDPQTFSSAVPLFIVAHDPEAEREVGHDRPFDGSHLHDQDHEQEPEQDDDDGLQLMINMDPPEHGQYRGIVNRRFSPRGMRILEDRIDEIAADVVDRAAARLVDDVAGRGKIDFVTEVAAQLPLAAIGELLGVPRERWGDMFDWTNQIVGSGDPEYQDGRSTDETSAEAYQNLIEYFATLAEQKRRRPGDDLMTTIVQAEIEGEPLPAADVIAYGFLLIIAGNETTRNATSGGMLALLEHPQQLQRLRAQPELLDSAVEEILRWTSPVTHMARRATQAAEIGGQAIAEGETVVMWYPSANRDEDVFEHPEVFDIAREPNEHLAFGGFGEHFCLGANLARLELRSIFRHILERMDEIELDGEMERLRSGIVGGIKHLPISFSAR